MVARARPHRSATAKVLAHPGAFALSVLKAFRANQGLLLAGAVAYYTLLSLVPFLILAMIVLSHAIDAERLLVVLREYLGFVVPGRSDALVDELRTFLEHRHVIGGVLIVTLVFFSALAFTVLENAMSVIFFHRVAIRRRHFLVSALIPYFFIVLLGIGFLVATLVSGALHSLGTRSIEVLGQSRSLEGVSATLLYATGVAGEILMLTSIYLVMPVGRLSLRHALVGGVTAGLLWEATRHVLVWYYAKMSQIQVVYGSLTTSIVVLLSVELAAIVLLLGAQVIAEYERVGHEPIDAPPAPMRTGATT
jgi:YihY family inner membrane protein